MKVFVTGATGFIGSHLAAALAARGDAVLALVRRKEQHAALAALGAAPVAGSLENERGLRAALEGVDIVYHAAGLTAARDASEYFAANDLGTRRLLDAARRAAPNLTRFVYVSSQAAVGPSPRGAPATEDAECRPVSAYGRSKLAGELSVRGSQLPWTVVRPPAVYGPRDRAFLSLFRLVRHGIAPVFGSGRQLLSLIYVDDLVRLIVHAGLAAAAQGEVLHAAHPEVVSSRDVARAAGRALGRSPLVIPVPKPVAAAVVHVAARLAAAGGRPSAVNADKLPEFLASAWVLDSTKAGRLLGWRAEVSLGEGMERTAAWYREAGWLA